MRVKKLDPRAVLPTRQSNSSSGLDLHAVVENDRVVLTPKRIMVVGTGLAASVSEGTEIQIRSRSGLAARNGVFVLNSPGTVDADYRGELKVILANFGTEALEIRTGDRIAQAVVTKVELVEPVEVEDLDSTERGSAGLGSTGVRKTRKKKDD